MELLKIGKETVREIFYDRMEDDFPDNELKPYAIMEEMLDRGIYDCFALINDAGNKCGYVYCIRIDGKDGNLFLIDYLAVYKEYRNMGLGSKMLALLKSALENPLTIICEVENPDYAISEDEKIQQNRRINFYLKNGMYETGATEKLYHVEYRLLDTDLDGIKRQSEEQTFSNIDKIYRAIMPEYIYRDFLEYHIKQ